MPPRPIIALEEWNAIRESVEAAKTRLIEERVDARWNPLFRVLQKTPLDPLPAKLSSSSLARLLALLPKGDSLAPRRRSTFSQEEGQRFFDPAGKVELRRNQIDLLWSLTRKGSPDITSALAAEVIQKSASLNDTRFFKMLGRVLELEPTGRVGSTEKLDRLLLSVWAGSSSRMFSRRGHRPPLNVADDSTPLCFYTDRAAVQFYAYVTYAPATNTQLKARADRLESWVTKRRQRLRLLVASKKLVGGLEIEKGELVFVPVSRNTA